MAYGTALAVLADPTRREVFERLARGPQAVGDLARGLPVSRPAVSQHLKVLKEAGLVTDRPDGVSVASWHASLRGKRAQQQLRGISDLSAFREPSPTTATSD